MLTIPDSSVWSLAFRRSPRARLSATETAVVSELQSLVRNQEVLLIGPVRQECLSGIRDELRFRRILQQLRAFPDEPLLTEDFERAADFFNRVTSRGLAATTVDLLICAFATRVDAAILAVDRDYSRYLPHCPIRLHPLSRT